MKLDYELILSFLVALLIMKALEKFVFPKIGMFEDSEDYETIND